MLRSTFPADLVVVPLLPAKPGWGIRPWLCCRDRLCGASPQALTIARCLDDVSSRRLLLATLACVHGLNRRELDVVLNEVEGKWLAHAKAVKLEELPPAVRLDLPDWLYEALTLQFDAPELDALAVGLNQSAPLDLRVNPLQGRARGGTGPAQC